MSNPKVVILCGGKGTRLREHTEFIPKPMVRIGNMPILWHIMKSYAHHGFKEFILCLGYKGEVIRDFFLNYEHRASDVTVHLSDNACTRHTNTKEDWKVTLVDTGLDTQTGERILRIAKYLGDSPYFLVTYGDGVSDLDIRKAVEFHLSKGTIATITGVHPESKYGIVNVDENGFAISFQQKPKLLREYVNGGFMVLNKEFLKYLKQGAGIEEPFPQLAAEKKLSIFAHDGFWHCMDTNQDYESLNKLWDEGNKHWCVWEK